MNFDYLLNTASGSKWEKIGTIKRSGICVPLFSIHSTTSTGIGDFNDIRNLVALCKLIDASILQLLPLNMAGSDNSPYNGISSFALDPVYISLSLFSYYRFRCPDRLISYLKSNFPCGKNNRCNYNVRKEKLRFLREIFDKGLETIESDNSFAFFVENNSYWLDEFAIYRVLRNIHDDRPWYEWKDYFVDARSEKIEKICSAYKKDILFEKWIQFICFTQMTFVKKCANSEGILLMGDLPILVSKDSADVWAKRELFDLNYSAGAPPDMYCAYGQRWGMPIQNRENLRKSNYRYLIEKLKYMDNFFDMIRIDHVVGLFRIWSIPADEPVDNQGLKGIFLPSDEKLWKENGKEILSVMNKNTHCLLCAEDLGIIPAVCPSTLEEFGIPGYDVQRWKKNYGFDYSFIPSSEYRKLSISSLSTHDTSLWLEWWRNEAGTIEKELFEIKCQNLNLDPEYFKEKLFEKFASRPDRLRWKKEFDSVEKIIKIFGRSDEEIRDIIEIYRDTFNEKDSLGKLLSIKKHNDMECLKKALEFIYGSSSIFCINLLLDIFCLDRNIAKQISHLRINKPGTFNTDNWSFAFEHSIEDLLQMSILKEIQAMAQQFRK